MNLYIRVSGLDELDAKASGDTVRGPVQGAIEAIVAELATAKGSGIGVQRNLLASSLDDMSATITTSLNWPRTSGVSWEDHTQQDFDDMADQQLESAGAAIEQAWEA